MEIEIYTSGKVEPRNSNHGGYAVLLVAKDEYGNILRVKSIIGYKFGATAYECQADAINVGLKALNAPYGNKLTIYSRNMTLVNVLNGVNEANKNKELITITQKELAKHGDVSIQFASKQDMLELLYMQEADKMAIQVCRSGTNNETT